MSTKVETPTKQTADDQQGEGLSLSECIDLEAPNLPERSKINVAIFDHDSVGNAETVFSEDVYLTFDDAVSLARDIGDVIRRYAATEAVPVASDSPDASEAELLTIIRELGPDYLAEKLRAAQWALHRHKQVARENRNTEKAASGELATVG
ncbi:hypothetical protein B7486_16625 [cyanobacterium TDX16]|nr:hypothetical protein B7486_16625 [cyanobacterium TDX16]